MTTTNTTDNATNNINENGPYFYALENKKENKRTANRFDRLFSGSENLHPEFVGLSNVPKYQAAIDLLIASCRDHGLDRSNLTRSQIVMAYNKAQRPLKLIAKFISLHGVQALLDNINAAGISGQQPVLDIRIAIIRSCSN